MNRLRGRYSKIVDKINFFDIPTTSCQEKILIKDGDTSSDVNYPNGRYKYLKKITDGSSSIIYEGYDVKFNKKVIIKKIKKNNFWREELNILEDLKNKTSGRILKIVDHFDSQRRSYIVTEFYEGYDLFDHIELNSPYTEYKCLQLIKEMAQCVKECHDLGIIHLDLKYENFMVRTNKLFENDKLVEGSIVLIDFGQSEKIGVNVLAYLYRYGTPYYQCPEGHYYHMASSKSDIWSLGVCLCMVLTNDYPFGGYNRKQYYENASEDKINLSKKVSSECYNLMKKCLQYDYNARPTIDEVIKEIDEIINMRYVNRNKIN